MANGVIKQQSNTVLSGYESKEIPYRVTTLIKTISIPDGQWLVFSNMFLSVSGNDTYGHSLGNMTVRTSEKNGGGSVNARVVTGPTTLGLQCYHNISNGCTVKVYWYAIKLL